MFHVDKITINTISAPKIGLNVDCRNVSEVTGIRRSSWTWFTLSKPYKLYASETFSNPFRDIVRIWGLRCTK